MLSLMTLGIAERSDKGGGGRIPQGAQPSAEFVRVEGAQLDEEDIGMPYAD